MTEALQQNILNVSAPFQLVTLVNKEQLNTIITNKNGTPDYLAINIYYDTLRSWYNPKIGYRKDGNVYHVNKLKTPGVFLDYKRLAQIHGCSKETIRQKIVKLEHLYLIHRSFQHIETVTTKSYNRLIAYVWKDTPHFYNPMGIDSDQVPELIAQTNHEYIERRYGVRFAAQAPQNKGFCVRGGIQVCLDTKELNNVISRDIRSNVQTHESNLLQNSVFLAPEEIIEPTKISKVIPLKHKPICNKRKKLTNAEIKANRAKVSVQKEIKAQVVRPVFYSKPKSLNDMHLLLDQPVFDELRSKSGREFSNNFIAQRVLAMSKKPKLASRSFKTRQGFIEYMACVLRNELHNSIKTGSLDFRLLANIMAADRAYQEQERFLTEIENSRQVTPEWHFKKKLASVLERSKAYDILSMCQNIKVHENSVVMSLKGFLELSELDKQIVLQQAKAVYETSSTKGEYKFIDKLEIVFAEQEQYSEPINQPQQEIVLPQGVWGNVLQKLIEEFGKNTYKNWFSKLTATVDELNKTMTLKAPSESAKDWIESRYQGTMERIASISGFKLSGLEC